MAYLSIDDENLSHDIEKRKEFYWTKHWEIPKPSVIDNIIPKVFLEKEMQKNRYLRLQGHQLFTVNFMNPLTDYKRLHLLWGTGFGKTIGGLSIAMRFIEIYKKQSKTTDTVGTVFIIGFSERQFKSELLNYPEFGFLSRNEKLYLAKLKASAAHGTKFDIDKYKEYIAKIKHRFTSRKGNGFFKFFGYKAFFNRLLIHENNADIGLMPENAIRSGIDNGTIIINQPLLDEFKNSLILCDEIHNVYNSIEKNNWGIAIQIVLDKVPSCRCLTMSATPINNLPSEIVDLLNLLHSVEDRIDKRDLFESNNITLKPGALDKIEKLARGRFSYVADQNPKYYPRVEYFGESIPTIPYLKFIRCKMSELQIEASKYDDNVDLVLPDPFEPNKFITTSNDIKKSIQQASNEWKKKIGVNLVNDTLTGDFLLYDNVDKYWPKGKYIMDYIFNNIKNNNGKMFIYHNDVNIIGIKLIEQLILLNGILDENSLPNNNTLCFYCGKTYKQHKEEIIGGVSTNMFTVKTNKSTVYLSAPKLNIIDEPNKEIDKFIKIFKNKTIVVILKQSHLKLIEYFESLNFTIVKESGKTVKLIKEVIGGDDEKDYSTKLPAVKVNNHKFLPIRYIIIHSDIEKPKMEVSLDRFNSFDNLEGQNYLILLGSRIMKESFDLQAIQNILITDRPPNISTTIQIRGRGVRKNSHYGLPPEKQVVRFSILVNSFGDGRLTGEELLYKKKIQEYQVIQKIEQVIHRAAIDSFTKDDKVSDDPLGALPWKTNKYVKNTLELSTFLAFNAQEEIDISKLLIKRLFIEVSHVWEIEELFKAVKNPPKYYDISIDTTTLSRESFIIALSSLLLWEESVSQQLNNNQTNITNLLNKVFDPNEKIIMSEDFQESVLICMDTYIIMFPFVNGVPKIDIETPFRSVKYEKNKLIDINDFIINKRVDFDYDEKKNLFYNKYLDISIEHMQNVVCEYGTLFHMKFIEECIEYVFKVWTDPSLELNDYHEFYFKMLYYYDLLSLVMWVHTTKPKIAKLYNDYAIPIKATDIKLKALSLYENREDKEDQEDISPDDNSELASSGVINLLKSTYNKTSNAWIPEEFRDNYMKVVNKSLEMFQGKKKKAKSIVKMSADLLPIGHYISKFPKIFHPNKGWDENPTYLQNDINFIENNQIIGFDERSDTGVHIRFKIRKPIHNIKSHKDAREIEKGTVCKSKSKEELIKIVKSIDGTLPNRRVNTDELCMIIRSKLIRHELVERIKNSNIKYFYFHYENRPELNVLKKI